MKRRVLTAATAVLCLLAIGARSAHATEVGYNRKFGVGVMVGAPTGIVAKLWIAPTNALDFGLGFNNGFNGNCWTDNNGFRHCGGWGYNTGTFNMDYLWQSNLIRGQVQLDWHVGLGGRVSWVGNCNGDCFWAAARAPIGLDLMFAHPNFLEVFFEVAFLLNVVPGVWGNGEGGLGVRFYF